MKTITVLAAHTQAAVLNHQCDIVESFDTIKEARAYAKRTLTDECMRQNEMSTPICYAQVVVNGECVSDYFRPETKKLPGRAKQLEKFARDFVAFEANCIGDDLAPLAEQARTALNS